MKFFTGLLFIAILLALFQLAAGQIYCTGGSRSRLRRCCQNINGYGGLYYNRQQNRCGISYYFCTPDLDGGPEAGKRYIRSCAGSGVRCYED
ncbi:hypothetical protein BJV82DRAFT_625333, partial [Fennellomyces sp. T-0311]